MALYLDDTTLNDLAIFEVKEGTSIFSRFNFTRTQGGEHYLRLFFTNPFNDFETIKAVQSVIKTLVLQVDNWPAEIGNGTVFMMKKFLKYRFAHFDAKIHLFDRITYIATERDDYNMLKFCTKVFADFFRGIRKINSFICDVVLPKQYNYIHDRICSILQDEVVSKLANAGPNQPFTPKEIFSYCCQLRLLRNEIHTIMDIFFSWKHGFQWLKL